MRWMLFLLIQIYQKKYRQLSWLTCGYDCQNKENIMKQIERKLLLAEAEGWVSDGLIDETLLARLKARYAEKTAEPSSDWRSVVFFSIGTLLVGLGLAVLVIAKMKDIGTLLLSNVL
jgi:uncharacterized membrane protein